MERTVPADRVGGTEAGRTPSVPPAAAPSRVDDSVWRTLVFQSPFSTVLYDADGRLLAVNEAFRTLWGVGMEAAPPDYNVLADPQLERQGVLPLLRRAFAGETVTIPAIWYDVAQVSLSGDGRRVCTQAHLYPIRDAQDRVTHVVLTHIDLTERISTEEALRASERRFAAIVQQAAAGIAQVDLEGRFLLVNDRYCEIVGRPRQALFGVRMQEITHPDDLEPNLALLHRSIEDSTPFVIEKRYLRPDGSVVWVNNSVTPIRDATGRTESVLAVTFEVTDRRRAATQLKLLAEAGAVLSGSLEYERTLQGFASLVVPDFAQRSMVFLLDESGRLAPVAVADADPAYVPELQRIARYLCETALPEGHPMGEALRTGDPQILRGATEALLAAAPDEEYAALVRALAPTTVLAVPIAVPQRLLGVLLCVADDAVHRFDDADLTFAAELARRVATAVDNARLYQAERAALSRTERLQRITSMLAAVLPAAEVSHLFVTEVRDAFGADTAWIAVLSEDRRELVTLAHSGFAEAEIAPWLRFPADAPVATGDVLADAQPRWFGSAAELGEAYPALRAAVREIDQEAVAFLPLRVGEQVVGVVTFGFRAPRVFAEAEREFAVALAHQCAQALERARLYEAEHAARMEAERANRAKVDFLAKMSHELRTPLNAIAGHAELIDLGVHGPVSPGQRAALERIQLNQRHLLGLITDILDFSKLEAGAVRLSIEAVEADEVLSALEPLIEPQMHSKGVVFEVRPWPEPLRLRGDRDRVVQICLNLLSNALKATSAGGRVTFWCEPRGGEVAFHVSDTGAGIPADRLEAIFSPFTQLGRSLSNPGDGGVGLGLAISRELALAMHGNVGVRSQPGVGSTFTLTLPAA